MHYAKVKRDKVGKCNLCLREGPLSWDHVPPKGSYEAGPVELRSILQALTASNPGTPNLRDGQSGVKYRTLCKNCNEWLGSEVDPTYNDFTRQIGLFLKSPLHLPAHVSVITKPARLLRSLLAHLVAAKADLDEVIFDRSVRPCCLDLTAPIPSTVHFHYWVYPHPEHVVLRDVGMPATRGRFDGEYMFCHLLKCYPVAFLVSDTHSYAGLPTLDAYRGAGPDEEAEVTLPLMDIRPIAWPEAPAEDNFIFGGKAMRSSVVAKSR